ncbi:MAG TPA: glycosyltransferase family 9 protein [Ignavibacteriaceae bacterium]|nr:glycosyltransferase family 9 protein [Ignavibacteriaceae bacterium]
MLLDKNKIKKILCIKPRGIGDIVLSTIILDNLKNYFGDDVKIDYLVEHFAKLSVLNNPLVNKVITMDKKEFPLTAALKIRKEKYDLVFDLWSNPRSAQITFFSGIKYRAGFSYRGRRYAYNILATSERGDHHSAEHNLELLKALEIPITSKKVHYFLSKEEEVFASNYFNNNFSNSKVAGIIPAGGWPSKRCDAEKWVEICEALKEKFNYKFLILWGPGDEQDAEFINSKMPLDTQLAPKTHLNDMAALISKCDLILANDSGPMHISAALGKPTLGIFGPTNPIAHGPYSTKSAYINKGDLFCIICNFLVCPYNHECMKLLPVDNIIDKVKKIIS